MTDFTLLAGNARRAANPNATSMEQRTKAMIACADGVDALLACIRNFLNAETDIAGGAPDKMRAYHAAHKELTDAVGWRAYAAAPTLARTCPDGTFCRRQCQEDACWSCRAQRPVGDQRPVEDRRPPERPSVVEATTHATTPTTLWTIQERKIWKGIDPIYPVWADRGSFLCGSYELAVELMDYLQRSNAGAVLRVCQSTWRLA